MVADNTNSPPVTEPAPRPLFLFRTLCAMPLLAWVLTGDASRTDNVSRLGHPARVSGFTRFAVRNRDYPAITTHQDATATVEGYLIQPETASQRRKLDNFEGEIYKTVPVDVTHVNHKSTA
ncbi:hypothetical protein BX600DRAFT_435360 [Xylariales sp. PMI_506]|nr:hypothetical protein BX600DRAFT_435360 [Xylariales sp. PMI_506]